MESRRIFLFILLLLVLKNISLAQGETDPYRVYESFDIQGIFNGRIYQRPQQRIEGSPFYLGNQLLQGSITYDSTEYQNLKIQYDIFQQLVVLQQEVSNANRLIVLDQGHLSSFKIDGKHFVTLDESSVSPGIYELHYNQKKTRFISRHEKDLKLNKQLKVYELVDSRKYYLLRSDRAVRVQNKKDVMSFYESDPQVKEFIRSQKLKFNSKNLELSVLKILENFNQNL